MVGGISVRVEDSASAGDSASISLDYVIKERKKMHRAQLQRMLLASGKEF